MIGVAISLLLYLPLRVITVTRGRFLSPGLPNHINAICGGERKKKMTASTATRAALGRQRAHDAEEGAGITKQLELPLRTCQGSPSSPWRRGNNGGVPDGSGQGRRVDTTCGCNSPNVLITRRTGGLALGLGHRNASLSLARTHAHPPEAHLRRTRTYGSTARRPRPSSRSRGRRAPPASRWPRPRAAPSAPRPPDRGLVPGRPGCNGTTCLHIPTPARYSAAAATLHTALIPAAAAASDSLLKKHSQKPLHFTSPKKGAPRTSSSAHCPHCPHTAPHAPQPRAPHSPCSAMPRRHLLQCKQVEFIHSRGSRRIRTNTFPDVRLHTQAQPHAQRTACTRARSRVRACGRGGGVEGQGGEENGGFRGTKSKAERTQSKSRVDEGAGGEVLREDPSGKMWSPASDTKNRDKIIDCWQLFDDGEACLRAAGLISADDMPSLPSTLPPCHHPTNLPVTLPSTLAE
ncbi:hypothetical protein C7M84_016853 [Penaeus vannamei]|uniref:Uncharacterized protein n=1 Tax=Penaeus vannamei TaxID=6689 RepID=A0A3R7QEV1_PENVA|nr:hypothetical protein C7M84_016853 [Penaeus vannamei]